MSIWDRYLPHMLVVLFLGLVGTCIFIATRPPRPPAPCSSFAEWPSESVPARCMKTFDGDKQ